MESYAKAVGSGLYCAGVVEERKKASGGGGLRPPASTPSLCCHGRVLVLLLIMIRDFDVMLHRVHLLFFQINFSSRVHCPLHFLY